MLVVGRYVEIGAELRADNQSGLAPVAHRPCSEPAARHVGTSEPYFFVFFVLFATGAERFWHAASWYRTSFRAFDEPLATPFFAVEAGLFCRLSIGFLSL